MEIITNNPQLCTTKAHAHYSGAHNNHMRILIEFATTVELIKSFYRTGSSNAIGNAIRHGLYGDHGVDAHCGGQHAVIAHIQLLHLPALAMGVDGAVAHRGAHPAATHVVHRAEEAPRLF